MNRFTQDPPAAVNTVTGEVLDMAAVNSRLIRLADALEQTQPEMERLLREHQEVSLRYELEWAASVAGSGQKSEDRRRAEATVHLSRVVLPGSSVDLATRRAVLEMQIKAMREASHNIRAEMSALQTVAANLRAETTIGGIRT